MAISILSTKLYIPPARAEAVSRPRLTDKLLAGLDQPGRFALVSGPAGSGKTTLLTEFVRQQQQPAGWLSLDDGDNDPIRFWTYLIAACQSVRAGIGQSALDLFQAAQTLPTDLVPTLVLNDLAKLDAGLTLVLDDYHVIHDPAIHAGLEFVLDRPSAHFHLIVSTRVDPPWPLARFRARNQLVELRAADLGFDAGEAAAFFRQTMNLNLTPDEAAALEGRTEGWIAGLQLAALSLQGRRDVAGFVSAFAGSHVYVAEYLVEEVLRRQPEAVQTFLLQTSILERLCAGLCEAVSGRTDCQALMRELYQANLFVLPLDDQGQWFRYHPLFADLLRARLRQSLPADGITALHRRAAGWFEQAGMAPEALDQALAAADYGLAVKIALPMILQGYVRTVERWLLAVPRAELAHSPRAILALAWLHLLRDILNTYIARVRNLFWPLVIAVSAVSAALLTTFNVNSPIRVAIAFWFMGFCPGMAFVGALRLKGVLTQITFAIALSLALDMLVSEAIVYAGIWSPNTGIILLAGLSFIGIGLQIIPPALHKAPQNGHSPDDIHS